MKRFGSIFVGTLLSTTALTLVPVWAQSAAPAGDAVEEIVVRGAYIPEPKRETSEISSFITPEDFERQGDSNVALSLRRVTGLSLVGGKFIYIRGLGERYSNANLNGLPLPSPEPLRRVVPLDLFPTSVLQSAAAQKTFSPQYSGEFGGGVIQIETKAIPDGRFLDVGVSFGGNTETTWKDGLTYDGGKTDFLGFDSGIRKTPEPLADAIRAGKRINQLNFTGTELQTIGRSMANSELWTIFEGTTAADFGMDATYGDRILHGDTSIGVLVSAGYDNSWSTKQGLQQTGRFSTNTSGQQVLVVADDFAFRSTQNDVRWHALLGTGFDWDENTVKLTSLYIRTTTKEARTQEGVAAQFGLPQRQDFSEWFERQMWTNQVAGEHRVADGDLTINWKGSYSIATRDAPYQRSVQYRDFGDGLGLRYDFQQGRNLTRFSTVDDTLWAGALDLTYRADIGEREATLKAGYLYTETQRDSAQRDYRLLPTGGPLPPALLFSRVDYIFSDTNINPGRFVLNEVTGSAAPAAYTGSLAVHGGYVGFDSEIIDFVRAALGVRYEDGEEIVDTFDFYTPNTGIETQIAKDYWLPAGTITWNFAENLQLRLGASKTIGRPQFRELAPSDFIDPDTDRQFVGNPNLVNSNINNLDSRVEWYFEEGQYVTVGGFYKKLTNPIEETINEAGDNLQTTFQNVPRADLYGAEFEFKYVWDELFDEGWLATKSFFVAANYTWSESKLKIKPGDTVIRQNGTALPAEFVVRNGRALQGHSKHLGNIQIGYEDADSGSTANLMLNFTSKRIRATSPQTLPEIIEHPPLTLDFTYSRGVEMMGGQYDIEFKAENLLNEKYQASQQFNGARVDVDTYKLGTSFSVGIKRHF